MTSNMGTIFSNTLETVAPTKLKSLEKNVLRHGTTAIPILSRKKLIILNANGEKTCCPFVILLENTGLVSIVMLMILNKTR